MMIHTRRIVAGEEIIDTPAVADDGAAEGTVDVAPEATDLLFEAEDVAELIAEVTGDTVEVEITDEDTVTFTVGQDEYVVEAEGTEEILESVRKNVRGKKAVTASTKKRAGRVIKKLPPKK